MAPRHGSATVDTAVGHRDLDHPQLRRAAVAGVGCAHQPAHLLRWWGPDWCPLVTCDVDLRVGGEWRYVSHGADGTEFAWHGTYRDVVAPKRIESTEVFEGFPDAESINTMTLVEIDGVTTLQTLVRHSCQEHRDGHVQSGMEAGMQQTFNRLDDLLVVADNTAERFRRVAAGSPSGSPRCRPTRGTTRRRALDGRRATSSVTSSDGCRR